MTTLSAPYKEVPDQEEFDFDIKDISPEDKKELLQPDVSDADSEVPPPPALQSFNSTRSYLVNATGVGFFQFPYPYNKELEIRITTPSGELAYTSVRESTHSGNAVLSAPGRGDLIASKYRFGPGRPPRLELLNSLAGSNEVLVSRKWTARAQSFKYAAVPIHFEWRYHREIVPPAIVKTDTIDLKKPKKQLVLALEVQGKDKEDVKRIAMLVRGDELRTPGTKRSYAGNGGELRIDELAAKALAIPEELIVATCVMMLKIEVDRRRCVQWAIMSGAASS